MIGQRIKQLRLEKSLTLSELAERSGVAKSYLSKIERSIQSNPSIQLLEKLADALSVSIDDILYGNTAPIHEIEIDKQWKDLILEAMASGVSKEQFREFLEFSEWKKRGE